MKRRDFLIATGTAGIAGAAAGLGLARVIEVPDETATSTPGAKMASPQVVGTPFEGDGLASSDPARTAEIQGRIDAISRTGGTVRIAAGTHRLFAPLRISGSFITLQGEGMGATIIDWRGPGAAILNSDAGARRDGVTVRDLSIDTHHVADASGIVLEHFQHALIERCRLQGVGERGVGVEFRGSEATYYNTVRGCWFNVSGDGGVGVRWSGGGGEPNGNRLIDTTLSGTPRTTLIDVAAGDTALILGCGAEGGNLLRLAGSSCQVIGTRFEGGPIRIDGNFNQFVGNSYAQSVEIVDRGQGNVSSGELSR